MMKTPDPLTTKQRLEMFDEATARQIAREQANGPLLPPRERGWRREDLYDRSDAKYRGQVTDER